jgi:GNAT superfamily N-acetyltransferase
MPTQIEPVDPAAARDLEDLAMLFTAYWREVLGDDEPETVPGEAARHLRLGRTDIELTMLLARDGDRAVGFASIDVRTGHGNEHMAWAEDVYVLPTARRHGVGRALLDRVVAIARARGRSLVVGGYHEGGADGEGFAKAVGATTANAERQNRVRVEDLDRAMLERWVADAATAAAGYSLVRFDDRCPDDLIDDVVRLAAVMNDAPRTESLGDDVYTAELHRAGEAERARDGLRYWFVAARHDATGELAGYTEMMHAPFTPWLVEQGDTAVAPAHRGHGIGRWLKAVNALRVLDERPDATVIETWNDGSNRWMLAINDAMGFRPVATWIETELQLS